jgi:hypothetical protein
MRNPFRAYSHAPAFFKLASIYAIVMAILIYGGCPPPPTPNTNNSNDNSSSNTNTNSSSNTNTNSSSNTNGGGSLENLNTTTNNNGTANDNGGDDVGGDDTKPPPATIVFEELVATGDAVPDATGDATAATFTDFGSPIIDASGRVAFWAHYTGGVGHAGLYVWEDGTIYAVIDDSGDIAVPSATPGQPTDEDYLCNPATLDIRTQPLTWSSDGRLLFVSAYSGPGNQLMARWSAEEPDVAQALLRVADTQSVADALGTSAAATSVTFSNIGRSDDGIVFFRMHFFDISANYSGDAVCKAEVKVIGDVYKISITPIVPVASASPPASARGAVPEQGSSAAFVLYDNYTTLSPGGYVLFQGAYDGGSGSHGLYLRTPESWVVRVIDNRPDYSWAGLDDGVVLGNDEELYGAIAISTNDHIAVQTPIIAGGSSSDHVILWDFAISQWTELTTDGGQAVTDLLSGVSDGGAVLGLAGSEPYVVSSEKSVSVAAALPTELTSVPLEWFNWGTGAGAINNSGHAVVLYTRSAAGSDGLGFWNNQQLLILADPQAAIPAAGITAITADSMPETDRPGRSGILNDADEAVFGVDFGTDNHAIYAGRAE